MKNLTFCNKFLDYLKLFFRSFLGLKFAVLLAACSFILMSSSVAVGNKNTSQKSDACGAYIDLNTFQMGETLTYKVNYKWSAINMTAGKATFHLNETTYKGKPSYHAKCVGRTASAFNWFYKVNDNYETYIDKESMRPLKFSLDINEGKYYEKTQYEFYHDSHTANVNFRYKKGKLKTENEDVDIPTCAQDIVSILYYARSLDFSKIKEGETVHIDLFTSEKIKPVSFRYLGKEVIKTKIGKVRCLKLSPFLLESDAFGDGGGDKMLIYATDDANKLPVLVESPVAIGKVRVHLTDYKGLKHPMTAKVD
ncbi:MAG: DUF3108 domain-containing protein [Chitinophagales bacterium]